MKDRIAHIMRAKNLKASDFATLLGIQPSGISHILSGRNQPSLEFVKKIKETFPEYNLDWIIFGTGPITTSEHFMIQSSDAASPSPTEIPLEVSEPTPNQTNPSLEQPPVPSPVMSQTVKNILILYVDGTFETFTPR